MNLVGIMISETSQRKTNTIWNLLYVEPKNVYIYYKKQAHRHREQIDGCQRMRVKGRRNGRIGFIFKYWGKSSPKDVKLSFELILKYVIVFESLFLNKDVRGI